MYLILLLFSILLQASSANNLLNKTFFPSKVYTFLFPCKLINPEKQDPVVIPIPTFIL